MAFIKCRATSRLPLFNSKELRKLKMILFSTASDGGSGGNRPSSGNGEGENGKSDFPDPPTNCCMSGCANCVYLEYAEQLTKIFKDSGEKSREIILSKISDPNMQAFLRTELQIMAMKDKHKSGDDK
ncbi:hypothetical protein LSTR_LSTR014031 [Laodelphax striatellus]|uniref:Oxidoreductase-like domain-containing protein n=1 Tax=Laodelphax striatellus TaxID=195883 RepID=A0A482WJ18_LAOST|nr:hypothetical protein LSTR_LSTR014031 [Laodelphax striatellus]